MQEETRGEKPMSEEENDETLDESFTASDPPSWSLGTDHGKDKTETKTETENSEKADRE